MKRFIPGSLLIILSVVILTAISCAQGSCFEETESYLKASFYTGPENNRKISAPDSITLYGLNNDSLLYRNKTGVQTVLIPLDASAESSKFVLIINHVADTIEFRYSSYPHLISKECGYTFYHHLDTAPIIKKHTFLIINETITNLNGENIRIFF